MKIISQIVSSYYSKKKRSLFHYALFHWCFLFFLAFFLAFLIPTCWYKKMQERKREKCEKNVRKMQENCLMQEQTRENVSILHVRSDAGCKKHGEYQLACLLRTVFSLSLFRQLRTFSNKEMTRDSYIIPNLLRKVAENKEGV